jgi:iron complex outermembrane receptor protein
MLWGAKILGQGAGQSPDAGYVVRNNTLVSATFAAVPGTQYGVYDQISRPDSSSGSNFFNFDAKLRVNDALTLTGQIGTSSADGKTPTQNVAEWNTGMGTGASWALNGINSAASWGLGTANNASPAGVGLGWIFGDQNIDVKDKDNWLKLDGDYALEQGALTKVKFGLRVADHSRSSAGVIGQGPGCKTAAGANLGFDWSQQYWCPVGTKSPADPANFPSGYSSYPANFGSGLGGSVPSNIWYYSPGQLATYNVLSNRSADGSRLDWNSTYSLKENTNSAYVQGNLDGKGWSGDVGLRMVQTKEHVVNNAAVDATTPGAVTTSAFGPYLPVSTDHDYIDALPSANLRLDLRKDLVARFGLSKSMTRPDYSALAGFISLSPGTGSGSGGNPDLKPVRSTNLDATLEWYFAPRALASVSAFYMDLTSYIGYDHVDKQFMTYNAINATTLKGYLAKYTLTIPVNSSATVKGLELGYEQPVFKNFGVAANFTYTDAREQGGGPVVGASRDIYNLSAYYEDEHLNARVSYNHRSSFFSGLDRSTAFYQADTDTVSASLGYKVSDNISLSLDARNLNNPKLRYYALNQDQPRSVYQNGRQYYLTARMTF